MSDAITVIVALVIIAGCLAWTTVLPTIGLLWSIGWLS